MRASEALLNEIEAFGRRTGLAASTICRRAVGDDSIPRRIRAGADIQLETAVRLRAWMRANPSARPMKTGRKPRADSTDSEAANG